MTAAFWLPGPGERRGQACAVVHLTGQRRGQPAPMLDDPANDDADICPGAPMIMVLEHWRARIRWAAIGIGLFAAAFGVLKVFG